MSQKSTGTYGRLTLSRFCDVDSWTIVHKPNEGVPAEVVAVSPQDLGNTVSELVCTAEHSLSKQGRNDRVNTRNTAIMFAFTHTTFSTSSTWHFLACDCSKIGFTYSIDLC